MAWMRLLHHASEGRSVVMTTPRPLQCLGDYASLLSQA